jgi:16S rRNA (guanine(966)-N(2))-methyltransferase RsmD
MRITGGSLKGWQLAANFAAHVRPSTDRMRESLFNKLSHSFGIEGICVLDLFSGSGIIALEFVSRGVKSVISVDRDVKNIQSQKQLKLAKNIENWQITKADVFQFLKNDTISYDIVFADPPYDLPDIQRLPQAAMVKLNPGGLFILEHRPGIVFNLIATEQKNYGSSMLSFFEHLPLAPNNASF